MNKLSEVAFFVCAVCGEKVRSIIFSSGRMYCDKHKPASPDERAKAAEYARDVAEGQVIRLEDILDHVRAERDALREALRVQDPRNANERYERIAADFEKETGLIAPGKDVHAAMSYSAEDEAKRQQLWRPFVDRWHEQFFDAVLSTPSQAADDLLARVRREERERCAAELERYAERIKHTSHLDGLGMGWQGGEQLCVLLAGHVRRALGDAEPQPTGEGKAK
jgi:hypothetical protein